MNAEANYVDGMVNGRHPLLAGSVKVRTLFDEWRKSWDEAVYIEDLFGLLHGLVMSRDFWVANWEQAVCFLLDVANGYPSPHFFAPIHECRAVRSGEARFHLMEDCQRRQLVAKRAFKILCKEFFDWPNKQNRESKPLWLDMMENEAVFHKVLWFFDRGEITHRFGGLPNSTFESFAKAKTPEEVIVADFLRDFAQLPWTFEDYGDTATRPRRKITDKKVIERLVSMRPQAIDFFAALDQLGWVVGRDFDRPSLKRLTELALGRKHPDGRLSPDERSEIITTMNRGSDIAQACLLVQVSLMTEKNPLVS